MGYGGYDDIPEQLHPDLRRFLDYWTSLHSASSGLPSREKFDLLALADLIPRFIMLEWVATASAPRLKYRLFGSYHQELFGYDVTGMLIDDVWDTHNISEAYGLYTNLQKSRKPHFWRRYVDIVHRNVAVFERLIVPLVGKDGNVAMFIGLWNYLDEADTEPGNSTSQNFAIRLSGNGSIHSRSK
jgi:hypothetical protein